ncbi:MAG: hypothetical protein ACRERU_01125 [Methylococcales bacterium]
MQIRSALSVSTRISSSSRISSTKAGRSSGSSTGEWKHEYRANPKLGSAERELAEDIAAHIEEDEVLATDVFLFQDYITPREFLSHWKRLGFAPRILPGVFGTRVTQNEARTKLDSTLVEYGQTPAPPDRPLVLVSPGGTPVWDDELPKLVEQVLDGIEQSYVLVLSKDLRKFFDDHPGLNARIQKSDRIPYYGPVRGTMQQAILPAFDRIVTRAGGGTVNHALAAGVGLVFVEEPQVQIKLIERECARLGPSGPPATLEEFRTDPKACIDRLVEMTLPKPQVAPALNAEKTIVERIISLVT